MNYLVYHNISILIKLNIQIKTRKHKKYVKYIYAYHVKLANQHKTYKDLSIYIKHIFK
jgi:hypothetical protein